MADRRSTSSPDIWRRAAFPPPSAGEAQPEPTSCTLAGDGEILQVSPRWRSFARANGGDPAACGVGANYLAVCERATGDRRVGAAEVAAGVRAVLAGVQEVFECEYACHAPTELRWFCVRIVRRVDGAEVSHHDITVRKLEDLARTRQQLRDPLTDLPNETLLTDRLEQALADGSRRERLVAVVILSIDNLAQVRRELGESVASALLVDVALRLTRSLRDGDSLGRLRDDQLAVVLRDLQAVEQAEELSQQMTSLLVPDFTSEGRRIRISWSAGVSVDQWGQSAIELLDAAGSAMYDAQRSGQREPRVVTPPPTGKAPAQVPTEARLRQAMFHDELVVHYQPVVGLLDGAVVGVEALVRWEHPIEGLLGPDLFIPVAEAGGLIIALGEWVLRAACRQAVAWRDSGLALTMAVNLSPRQIAHPDLLSTVSRILRETGLDPTTLVLEVTETAVMEDAEVALAVLDKLSGLGINLAIDDFGTGYSSLLYLKRYPISTLKVDRSFVAGLGLNEEDTGIVASLVALAAAVGATCIAEGIETDAQYAALRGLGSGFGQGWLFGRAVEADQLPELVLTIGAQMKQRLLTVSPFGDAQPHLGDHRDKLAAERDSAADQRDRLGDERDEAGDVRDYEADRRDRIAEERDAAAELRDDAAAERDEAAALVELPSAAGERSAQAREAAASDRTLALEDRLAGAGERDRAERDRDTAQHDRHADADERARGSQDRAESSSDRDASAAERNDSDEQLAVLSLAAARDQARPAGGAPGTQHEGAT